MSRRRRRCNSTSDGMGVVRIKPLGAGGGGGGEKSASSDRGCRLSTQPVPQPVVSHDLTANSVSVAGRKFSYPSHVLAPEMDQASVYELYMPERVALFLSGHNVNIVAYGQTGSGKTHTIFGPPRIMSQASMGLMGEGTCDSYGLFPRGLIDIFQQVQARKKNGEQLSLTASAVELSFQGNVDMMDHPAAQQARERATGNQKKHLSKGIKSSADGGGHQTLRNSSHDKGVILDSAADPPRLYGMTEHSLESAEDLFVVYAALATRNTASTGMNSNSSRTHCFTFLTLRSYDAVRDEVLTSRFQFVDLAGSERMEDAHGTKNWKEGGLESMKGMANNYSLMMLSSCIRNLVQSRRSGTPFSFRAFLCDLPLLLQESISGSASTACVVCLSQAPEHAHSSKIALDFGEVFSKLKTQPRQNRPRSRVVMLANAPSRGGGGGGGGGGNKYTILADARGRDGEQLRSFLEGFQKNPNEAASCSQRTLRKKEMEEDEESTSSGDEIPEQYRHK